MPGLSPLVLQLQLAICIFEKYPRLYKRKKFHTCLTSKNDKSKCHWNKINIVSSSCSTFPGKRNYYACEVCNLVTCNLATHLKRKCMKGKSKDDVDAALLRARDRVYFHIRDHLVITYDFVKDRLKLTQENLAKVVKLLEELGHTVTKKPPAVQWVSQFPVIILKENGQTNAVCANIM